jgi:hypothetical protein
MGPNLTSSDTCTSAQGRSPLFIKQLVCSQVFHLLLVTYCWMRIFLFVLPFSHVSWKPPNIHRSSSDFFYPKSLIRRTGRSLALQVGAVFGPKLRATVVASVAPSPQCCFSHIVSSSPMLSSPHQCASHSNLGCFLLWLMFSFRVVAKHCLDQSQYVGSCCLVLCSHICSLTKICHDPGVMLGWMLLGKKVTGKEW